MSRFAPPRRPSWRLALLGLGAAALLVSSCSRSPGDLLTMDVEEWSITVDPDTAESGPVRLDINHTGELEHELALMPGTSPDDIPRNEDGTVDTATRRPIDQIKSVTPGTYRVNAPNIPQGEYLWVCTLVTEGPDGQTISHLDQGMWAPLVITRRQGIVDDQT